MWESQSWGVLFLNSWNPQKWDEITFGEMIYGKEIFICFCIYHNEGEIILMSLSTVNLQIKSHNERQMSIYLESELQYGSTDSGRNP